jgi:hypothetical protein
VICVAVGFRQGYPEVSDRNATFNALKASGAFAAGAENAKIHPAVAPMAEEIVVTKHRVSALAGTDLDLMLRANGIETQILTGIVTSGVVLSALRHAADADWWSSAIAALTTTRKRIGCCLRRSFRARPPSRRLRDSRRPSGLGGRRHHCFVSIAPVGGSPLLTRAGRRLHDGPELIATGSGDGQVVAKVFRGRSTRSRGPPAEDDSAVRDSQGTLLPA